MTSDGVAVFSTTTLPWQDFSDSTDLPEHMRNGVRRQQFANGESGYFAHVAEMVPGYKVEPHSHSHSEFFLVLAGSCQLDTGERLASGDAAVFPADFTYGFTCGEEGVRFCVVRTGRAEMTIEG